MPRPSTLIFFGLAVLGGWPCAAFEVCTSQNNYLEALLPPPTAPAVPAPEILLSQACVQASQASLAPTGYYGFCPSPDGQPVRNQRRPCLSEKYVSAVYTSLINVSDCLGVDPRLAFATFNLESAVHLNAVGAATDVGIGQLTKSAIDEVTLNALDHARVEASRSSRPSCQAILPYMTPHGSDKTERCGFMSLPENPNRNLVYSILLIEQNRKAVDRFWDRLQIHLPASIDIESLKWKLTMLAYNSGAAGAVATLKAYVDQMGSHLSERSLHFENRSWGSFPTYLSLYFPSQDKGTRSRVSKYIGYIAQAARRVETLAGVACFDPSTFPPFEKDRPEVFSAAKRLAAPGARQIIQDNMDHLADLFDSEDKAADCTERKAAFLFAFLPRGQSPQDLSPRLYRHYLSLCAE